MNKIILLILISSQILSAQTINDLYFGTDTTIDIISWNIEWFPKNNSTADEVQEILNSLDADIYALQEIEDTLLLKQVVSNIPGYECYFKSSYYGGLAFVYNTNTIQVNSRYEIFTTQPYWNAFPRSPQVLDCNFMGNNYIIINNHFKCCGDGILDINYNNDEENRRLQAATYLKQYIDNNLVGKRVVLLGDLNDELTDNTINNVFQDFINDSINYFFTDMLIAQGNSVVWSYPTWPSHLDHILITNELFSDFQNFSSLVSVIRIDDYIGGWNNYESNVSDHRPIGIKLGCGTVSYNQESISTENRIIKVFDILGRDILINEGNLVFKLYDNGVVEKTIIIK